MEASQRRPESPKSVTPYGNPQRQPRVKLDLPHSWADIDMTSPRIPGDQYFLKQPNIITANNGIRKKIPVIFATLL